MNLLNKILMTKKVVAVAVAFGLAGGCSALYPPLDVVENVDLIAVSDSSGISIRNFICGFYTYRPYTSYTAD